MKLKKGKKINDVQLAIGKGLKDTYGNTVKQREQIAVEIDKVCIIANWENAVIKMKISKLEETLWIEMILRKLY